VDAADMSKSLPPQSVLQEMFEYSVITGALYWRVSPSRCVKAGSVAGSLEATFNGKVYRRISVANSAYMAHRLIWRLVTGEDPAALPIDHVNGDGSDNAWHNLRLLAAAAENSHNRQLASDNTSGCTGVSWDKQKRKWIARIMANGSRRFLGHFPTPEEAHRAYLRAKRELHPSAPAHHFAGVQ
jgi:hypothetical protein